MSDLRKGFLKELSAASTFPGLFVPPGMGHLSLRSLIEATPGTSTRTSKPTMGRCTLVPSRLSRGTRLTEGTPVRVFATQEVQRTGAQGSVTGILLQGVKPAPPADRMKNLSVIPGRVVPPKTVAPDLDAAAADTLRNVTCVVVDVEATPAAQRTGAAKKSGAPAREIGNVRKELA